MMNNFQICIYETLRTILSPLTLLLSATRRTFQPMSQIMPSAAMVIFDNGPFHLILRLSPLVLFSSSMCSPRLHHLHHHPFFPLSSSTKTQTTPNTKCTPKNKINMIMTSLSTLVTKLLKNRDIRKWRGGRVPQWSRSLISKKKDSRSRRPSSLGRRWCRSSAMCRGRQLLMWVVALWSVTESIRREGSKGG